MKPDTPVRGCGWMNLLMKGIEKSNRDRLNRLEQDLLTKARTLPEPEATAAAQALIEVRRKRIAMIPIDPVAEEAIRAAQELITLLRPMRCSNG